MCQLPLLYSLSGEYFRHLYYIASDKNSWWVICGQNYDILDRLADIFTSLPGLGLGGGGGAVKYVRIK